MARVIINNVEYEGNVDERVIDVARRNGAHIGFLCDGLGLCQTCACRVLQGSENLSPPSGPEQNWFQQSWLDDGHRLGCQTYIRGSGTIEILSRAEELRRMTADVFAPPQQQQEEGDRLGQLSNNIGRIVMNQVVRFPLNAIGAFRITLNARPNLQTIPRVFNDTVRVFQTMLGGSSTQQQQQREQ